MNIDILRKSITSIIACGIIIILVTSQKLTYIRNNTYRASELKPKTFPVFTGSRAFRRFFPGETWGGMSRLHVPGTLAFNPSETKAGIRWGLHGDGPLVESMMFPSLHCQFPQLRCVWQCILLGWRTCVNGGSYG